MTEKKTVQANFNFDITKLANDTAQQEIAALKSEIKELTQSYSNQIDSLGKQLRQVRKERDEAERYRNIHEYTKDASNNAKIRLNNITKQLQEIFKSLRSKRMGALIDYLDDLDHKDVFLTMESDIDELLLSLKFVNSKLKKTPTKKEKK